MGYNPNEPRDWHGRWTAFDAATAIRNVNADKADLGQYYTPSKNLSAEQAAIQDKYYAELTGNLSYFEQKYLADKDLSGPAWH
jgi:hypothetical protein